MRLLFGLMTLLALSACGGGGDGSPDTTTTGSTTSAPVISSLSPTSATTGAAALTLTVNGSGFVSGSVVDWNGGALTTTFVSATQLTASVPAADLAAAGTASITVVNSSANGGTSTAATFSITAAGAPTIASLSPAAATVGAAALTLTVNGTDFVSASVVDWNGAALTTTFVSATQLTASVPAADLAAAGSDSVTVVNPGSSGGTSAKATFSVTSQGTGGGGPQLVQYKLFQTSSNNDAVNTPVQFTSPTKAGDTIWVAVTLSDFAGVHTIAVQDSQNNTFTLLDQENDGAPGSQTVAHFYAGNIKGDGATPDTVTVIWTDEDYKGVLITEISGTSTAPLVGHGGHIQDGLGGGTNNVTAGAINVTGAQVPGLLVAVSMNTTGGASDIGGTGVGGPTAGSGFTQVDQFWNWGTNLATFETGTVTGAESATATFSATDTGSTIDSYVSVSAVFH
jgi:hypothetical protein